MLTADLRYAVRTLPRSPIFTTATVLTMALTIGANTTIFSVVNAVLIRPLPFASPERLMQVAEKNDKLNISNFSASLLNYLSWKEQNRSFQGLGAIGGGTYTLTGRGDPEQINGATISPSLLPILGIQPVLGRGFRESEDLPGAAPVALISQALWRRRFAGEHSAIGAHMMLNGVDHTVVGIAPGGLPFHTTGDTWTPLVAAGVVAGARDWRRLLRPRFCPWNHGGYRIAFRISARVARRAHRPQYRPQAGQPLVHWRPAPHLAQRPGRRGACAGHGPARGCGALAAVAPAPPAGKARLPSRGDTHIPACPSRREVSRPGQALGALSRGAAIS